VAARPLTASSHKAQVQEQQMMHMLQHQEQQQRERQQQQLAHPHQWSTPSSSGRGSSQQWNNPQHSGWHTPAGSTPAGGSGFTTPGWATPGSAASLHMKQAGSAGGSILQGQGQGLHTGASTHSQSQAPSSAGAGGAGGAGGAWDSLDAFKHEAATRGMPSSWSAGSKLLAVAAGGAGAGHKVASSLQTPGSVGVQQEQQEQQQGTAGVPGQAQQRGDGSRGSSAQSAGRRRWSNSGYLMPQAAGLQEQRGGSAAGGTTRRSNASISYSVMPPWGVYSQEELQHPGYGSHRASSGVRTSVV
jgi:hypothetical protein